MADFLQLPSKGAYGTFRLLKSLFAYPCLMFLIAGVI